MSSVYHTIGRNIGLALSRHAVQPIVGICIVMEGIFFVAVVKKIFFFVVLVVVVLLFTE